MKKMFLEFCSILLCAGIMFGDFSTACAQEDNSDGFTLEEITVTAQKRTENAQDTPISLAYTSGEVATTQGITNITDVLRSVPGVQIDGIAKGASVFIRGVGAALDSQIGSPAVNFNIDGRYQHQSATVTTSFYDVNRVEVLRGPQGTISGRNATAGSVNLVTNDPTNQFDARLTAQLGNYALIRTEGMINTPLTDETALRLAFATEKHDGYLTNGFNDADTKSVRAKYLYEPNEDLRVLFTGDYNDMGGTAFGTVEAPIDERSDPWEGVDPKGYADVEAWSLAAQLDWNVGFADLTFIPSHQDFTQDSKRAFGGSDPSEMHATDEQTSLEARLASRPDAPFKWLAGIYYLDSDKTDYVYSEARMSLTVYPKIALKSYAAFGQLNVPVSERIDAYVGLRYTKDEQSNHGYIDTPLSSSGDFYTSNEWDSVDYRVGIEGKLSGNSMVYAQVASGYKAGGFFQGAEPNSYEPEELIAYQIGTKNRFLNNRLQLNGEVFYYDYTDYQVQSVGVVNPPPQFGLVIVNAGKAEVYGGELESTVIIGPSDRLEFSLAYLQSEFITLVVPDLGLGPGGDFSGDPLPHSPEWSGNIAYDRSWLLGNGGSISARAELKFSSGYNPSYQKYPGTYQDSYTLSNLFLGYETAGSGFSIRGYVKNIGDEPVMESAYKLGPPNPISVMLNTPRTYGVILSMNF